MPEPARPHVVILGAMGVGKSTTGKALAHELGWRYVDSDTDIERLMGCSGAEYAKRHGVPELHQLEAAVLLGALAAEEPAVITAAASTVEHPLAQGALPRRAVVVRLVLSRSETIARQAEGAHRRPMSRTELELLSDRREPFFEQLEDLRLDAARSTDQLVDAIIDHLRVA